MRHPLRLSYLQNQKFIETIVGRYAVYKAENDIRTYLKAIAYRLKRPAVDDEDNEEGVVDEEETN